MTTQQVAEQPPHSAIADTFAVVRSALRLMWRHWPTLIALALAGFAARHGILLVSVEVSEWTPAAAVLVFALVPVSMLVAMLMMMRVVRRSLPESTPIKLPDDRNSTFNHIASVLVPFLAVYAAYDYFVADEQNFRYEVFMDEVLQSEEFWNNPGQADVLARLPSEPSLTMVFVIGSAIILRTLLGVAGRRTQGNLFLGVSRGYLEATWVSLAAMSFNGMLRPVEGWVMARQMWTWGGDLMDGIVGMFGPLSPVVGAVVGWFGEILATTDAVLLIPFAWLTIGCVVYGHELVSPPRTSADVAALRRWQRLPAAARTMLLPVRNSADERFGPIVRAFRLLKHAGLRTMVLFCLAFVVAQSLPEWLWELQRLIIGPAKLGSVWVPLSGPMSTVNEAIGLTLTICLVTAAADHVLRVPPPAAEPEPQPEPEPEPKPETKPSLGNVEPDEPRIEGYPSYLYGDGFDALRGDEDHRGPVVR
ncbi:MAG TPA: hypothetical protein VF062_17625 [Candidatus Limnocylindrales bacterium]